MLNRRVEVRRAPLTQKMQLTCDIRGLLFRHQPLTQELS